MADTKISALTEVTAPATSDPVPIVNGATTKKVTLLNLLKAGLGALSQGTITDPAPAINHTVTWNDAADTFVGIKSNVTDTASGANSLLLDLQVGGVSKFNVKKDGSITAAAATFSGNVLASAVVTYDLGSVATRWRQTHTQFLAVGGADAGTGGNFINFPNSLSGLAWNNVDRLAFDGTNFSFAQASGGQFRVKNGGGTTIFLVDNDGGHSFALGGISLGSGMGSTAPPSNGLRVEGIIRTDNIIQLGGTDTGLARNAAGVVEINNGSAGTLRDLKLRAIEMVDGNIVLSTSTGTKIGTATGQKLSFWNATPVVQQVLATGAGATVDNVISLLQTLGLCKQS